MVSSNATQPSSSATPAAPTKREPRTQNGQQVSRPYACGMCGKAFIRNEHLRRHVLTHSGEKPFMCNVCGKAFSRREHLSKHSRSHDKAGVALSEAGPPVPSATSVQQQQMVACTTPASTPTPLQPTTIQVVGAVTSQSGVVQQQQQHHQQQHQHDIHHSGGGVVQPISSLTVAHTPLPTPGTILSATSAPQVVASAHQATIVTHSGMTHSVPTSHGTPVGHLPSGTTYLPMFGILAEVV